jgi:hypothetical protein
MAGLGGHESAANRKVRRRDVTRAWVTRAWTRVDRLVFAPRSPAMSSSARTPVMTNESRFEWADARRRKGITGSARSVTRRALISESERLTTLTPSSAIDLEAC